MSAWPRVTALDPAGYRRTPWKNGGGVAVDIAGRSRPGAASEEWSATLWRFGRTSIVTGAPFSDLNGYERLQVLVAGEGLVLKTPEREIDVRRPFVPVRFGGELAIVSQLEAGPVEVVNLIGERATVAIDLVVLGPGDRVTLSPGTHVLYAPAEACALRCEGRTHALGADHGLQVECDDALVMEGLAGRLLLASVFDSHR